MEGRVASAQLVESGPVKAFVWKDTGGKKVVIKRTNRAVDADVPLRDHIESLLYANLKGIDDGVPDRLVIELEADGDTPEEIRAELNDIEEGLGDRAEFIGGPVVIQRYADWLQDLETASQDRVSNKAYLRILTLLDQAIRLENTRPLTPDIVQNQIDILNQITQEIPGAASTTGTKKAARNDALTKLQSNIAQEIPLLQRQRINLLRQIESEIAGLGTAKRTPSEVLVHFLHSLRKARKDAPASTVLKELEQQVRQTILQHQMTLAETQRLLQAANARLTSESQPELATLTTKLIAHLPKDESALPRTRLHDNLYGRVLDSGIVAELVKNPPPGVKTSLKQGARAMAAMLRDGSLPDKSKHEIAQGMQEYLNTKDPRFWVPLVPSIKDLKDAKSPEDALKALLTFLDNPGDDGYAMIATPYVLVKTANILQQKKQVTWMEQAGRNYWNIITNQTGRTDVLTSTDPNIRFTPQTAPKLSEGAGIGLRHQPNPFIADGMVPSMRPTLKNMPQFEQGVEFPTDSVATALQHGLPFASGVSGSTNIMLHLLDEMRNRGETVDVKNFLLGTMMFLVYDGGHSMQEVLWTANQLDATLNLNLNIGDPSKPTEFVADYERFAAIFDGDRTGPILQDAINTALDTTLNFFAQRSVYSDDRVDPSSLDDASPPPDDAPPSPPDKKSAEDSSVEDSEASEDLVKPPPASPEFGDLSHPNPALYFQVNDQENHNFRVDSVNPGEGWVRVEQFCSVLATHWLTQTPGQPLAFSDLADSDRDNAIQTLNFMAGNGLPAQVQHAQTALGGTSESLAVVETTLKTSGFPSGTPIWFASDRHAQAALVLPNDRYQVYNPDTRAPFELSRAEFRQYLQDAGINAVVIGQIPSS